ncbi:hypothetical protein TRIUR3_13186 [Triticum urartu]|uniref:pyridoxal 5'-phosphate synthase n=1 Tax=Triticum urartu TaxID=4572 RepID=M7ZNG6_TRIUA|nr:hypothetical protein TRIUR3_13186 [Triticum urartu]
MPIGALYRADGVEDDYYAGGEREGVEGTTGEACVEGAAGLSPRLGSIPSSFPRAPHQKGSATSSSSEQPWRCPGEPLSRSPGSGCHRLFAHRAFLFLLLADSLAGLVVRIANEQIGEIKEWPLGEICWYFTDSWEQFRISGIIDVIDGSCPDPAKLQQREKAWFASSVKSRLQYLGPSPGVPVANDDHVTDVHLDPSAGPVDAYCLLTLDPEKVDYVNLKSNQRLMFTRTQEGDESSDWMAKKVSP